MRTILTDTVFPKESLMKSTPSTWDDQVHTQVGVIKTLGGIKTLLKEHNRPNSHEDLHLWKRCSTRQLTKLITNFSKDYAGNTVDNPTKEECKALGERTETVEEKRKRDENELRQLQKRFKQLGLTFEEAYDEFTEELDEY
ncbi:hypothetical protein L195_g019820 [Trifolium pratense]|uniref:Uncharacterized protein n=1 Tax=Trifolium pratense TaxID=57577 RepID=A0A2K3N0N9_TRIPR|nr:hypothetical protein L195_g019820 [Trifolium pratense]